MILRAVAVVLAIYAGAPTSVFAQQQPAPQTVEPPTEPPQMGGTPPVTTAPLKDELAAETITLAARPALAYSGQSDWDDSEKALSSAINLLYATVARNKLEAAGPPMVEYLENSDDEFRFLAYLPILPTEKNSFGKDITLGQTPVGVVQKYTHQGSYEDLEDVYARIEDQLTAASKEMKRVVEEYVSDPASTSPDQMMTNIYVFTE